VFDRVSVSNIQENVIIFCCRISKSHKNKNITKKICFDFLFDNNIISQFDTIKKHTLYEYTCYYRDVETRENIIKRFQQLKNIFFLRTYYFGHFLNDLIISNNTT